MTMVSILNDIQHEGDAGQLRGIGIYIDIAEYGLLVTRTYAGQVSIVVY